MLKLRSLPFRRAPVAGHAAAQVKAVAEVLMAARAPPTTPSRRASQSRSVEERLPQIIDTLVAVGRVRRKDGLAVIA